MDKNEFELKLKDIEDKMKNLMLEKDTIQQKLETSVEDRAPQPAKKDKRERFILIKRNDETYPYYATRAQDVHARGVLKHQRSLYTEVCILLDLPCHPNSKTLFVRVRDELKNKGVTFKLCNISLAGSTINEEELIKAMNTITDEKRVL
ncbi:putative KilA-N domain-containing protein 006L [Argiope bruennichi]|uniref:Putative KilA-N domain-containing protein 006L n=1 Tax=Argiope bruennichi TaxID=94029 RepID=A0A8T0EAL1_ARGBR|nr:putative KilA-N domain-containing protein 006L [Argiope bruennichi]